MAKRRGPQLSITSSSKRKRTGISSCCYQVESDNLTSPSTQPTQIRTWHVRPKKNNRRAESSHYNVKILETVAEDEQVSNVMDFPLLDANAEDAAQWEELELNIVQSAKRSRKQRNDSVRMLLCLYSSFG
jgi:hypothetical protein